MFRNKKTTQVNPKLLASIQRELFKEKAVLTWSVEDVGAWLSACGYGEYAAKFIKNRIGGPELVTLTTSDLRSIGVAAVGHQKGIRARVTEVSQGASSVEKGTASTQVASSASQRSGASESDLSSADGSDDGGSSSATNAANKVELVCTYGASQRVVVIKRSYTLERVLQRLEEQYGFLVELFVRKKPITDAVAWSDIMAQCGADATLEVEVVRESANKIGKEERQMLHGLADSCFVMDTVGTILFCNMTAEELFGYSLSELEGQNIRMMTPPDVRVKHDHYLRRYLETGNSTVIGSGRSVRAVHKDGREIPCWLSVTEQKKVSGRHTYMGILHEVKSRDAGTATAKFAVLDAVQDAVVVINAQGIIQFVNSHTEKLLGLTSDVLGRNVTQLMPEPYASAHDGYLRNFLKAGRPKIIGKGARIVVAMHANGSLIPVRLEVDECVLEGQRHFVGLLQAKDAARKKKVSLLERTRTVTDQLAVAAAVIDPKGNVLAFNKAAAVLFGFDPSEVLNKNVKMLMNSQDAAKHDDYLLRYMTTGVSTMIGKFRHVTAKKKNGQEFSVMLSLSRSEDPDDAQSVLFTGTFVAHK